MPYPDRYASLLPDPEIPGDDCLNLNVWTPDPSPGAGLPVMVWIHGGALTRGSSAVPVYDGSAFARDGIVLVSLNYRLGALGYGVFPDAPANRGLLDQIAALTWVRDNIGAFGGDLGRVTVFGESAYAISVGALLAAPRAAGLFARAVMQSGPPEVLPRERARPMVRKMASLLKVPATATAFTAVALPDLLAAQAAVLRRTGPVTGGPAFGLVADPESLPGDPASAAAACAVPLLLGWTAEEHRLWLAPTGAMRLLDRMGPLAVELARVRSGKDRAAVRALRAALPGAGPADLAGHLLTDRLLRDPLQPARRSPQGRSDPPVRVRLAQRRAGSRCLPRTGAGLRLRHPPQAGVGLARGTRRAAGTGRRDARGLGPVRRRRGPGMGSVGRLRPAEGVRRAAAGGAGRSAGRGVHPVGRRAPGPVIRRGPP